MPNKLKKTRKKSEHKTKCKTSEHKTSIKKTWEKLVQQTDSRSLLKDSWKIDKDRQKEYSEKIGRLYKKYSDYK